MVLASIRTKGEPVYVLQRILELHLAVDEGALRHAWGEVVRHHSILRSQFTFSGSEIYLHYLESWRDSGWLRVQTVREPELAENAYAKDYESPFVFDSTTPLWRLLLVHIGEKSFLCITFHHGIVDQRTLDLLFRDLEIALQNTQPNRPANLPPAPGFHDYLDWRAQQDFSSIEKKWRAYAAPLTETTSLPDVLSALPEDTHLEQRFDVPVPESLAAGINVFAERCNITPNTILLGGWALLLSRLTGQEVVSFGVVRAGHANSLPNAKAIAGPLFKTLPFIQPVPEKSTSADYLKDVRQRWQFLYEADHCPMDRLMNWMDQPSPGALFTTVLNSVTASESSGKRAGQGAGISLAHARQNKVFEPTLAVHINGALELEIISPASLQEFCRIAARALPHVLAQLLKAEEKLENISLCAREHEQVDALSRGPRCKHSHQTIASLIEECFARQAALLAFDGPCRKTFAELDRDSRTIAAKLALYQVDNKRPIAIVLPAGPLCTTTLIAVLRSGGNFICLNPKNPMGELLEILSLTKPGAVVTSEDLTEAFSNHPWMVTTVTGEDLDEGRPFEFKPEINPNDLAYLVHTSGTTGTPKVIQIEHHSVANLVAGILPIYALKAGDRRLHLSQPGTDFFIAESLVTLCGGATLVFTDATELKTPAGFLDQLDIHRISVTGIPSSFWREVVKVFIDNGAANLPPSLRLVIVGMETVDPEMLRAWNRLVPNQVQLLNVYGPSETTIIATTCDLREGIPEKDTRVPIGKPVPNTDVYVLDHVSRALPRGAVGEICISGSGVMRGYAGRDAEQDQSFNPYGQEAGYSRFYRTGDFGYFNGTGNLVFAGRRDQQVKIRGHRVELGAVESHLSQAAGGANAVAISVQRSNQNVLLGMVESMSLTADAVRDQLRCRVKDSHIPSSIFFFETFPRLPSGKIDRSLLRQEAEMAAKVEAPDFPHKGMADSNLDKMISVWNRIFEVDDCTGGSNFFEMGGDSWTAVSLCLLAEETLRIEVPLNSLYSAPTIGGLVRGLERRTALDSLCESTIRLAEGPGAVPIVCVHGWGGHVGEWLPLAAHFADERDCWGLQAVEHAGNPRPGTLHEMCDEYADTILSVYPDRPVVILGYSLGGTIAYETACRIEAKNGTVQSVIVLDSLPPNASKSYFLAAYAPYFFYRAWVHLRTALKTRITFSFLKDRAKAAGRILMRGTSEPASQSDPDAFRGDYYEYLARCHVPEKSSIPLLVIQSKNSKVNIRLLWSSFASGPFSRVFIDASHRDMIREPAVSSVARIIREQAGDQTEE